METLDKFLLMCLTQCLLNSKLPIWWVFVDCIDGRHWLEVGSSQGVMLLLCGDECNGVGHFEFTSPSISKQILVRSLIIIIIIITIIIIIILIKSKIKQLISLKIFSDLTVHSFILLQVLCVEGAEFEPYPTCLSLPAKAGPHTVILLGIPRSVGSLRITG